MHIENNMFENIFNTVMDIKGKIKDNIRARMDITLFYERMRLVYVGSRRHSYLSNNGLKVYVFLLDVP
jgi:hypothetical protein